MMTELEQAIDRGDRGRKWFLIAIGLVCAAIVGGIGFAIYVNFSQGRQISKIESPCLKYGPDSKQCEEAFSAAVSTITHPQACAIERKAGTLQAIRELAADIGVEFTEPCAGARIAQERERSKARSRIDQQGRFAGGGGAQQTGSTGHQQPGPRDGGQKEAKPDGGPETSPPPTGRSAGSAAATNSPDDSAPQGQSLPGQATDSVDDVADTATGAVDQVTDDVGETVEQTCQSLSVPIVCAK